MGRVEDKWFRNAPSARVGIVRPLASPHAACRNAQVQRKSGCGMLPTPMLCLSLFRVSRLPRREGSPHPPSPRSVIYSILYLLTYPYLLLWMDAGWMEPQDSHVPHDLDHPHTTGLSSMRRVASVGIMELAGVSADPAPGSPHSRFTHNT